MATNLKSGQASVDNEVDLAKVTPPKDLSDAERETVFLHLCRRLASYRNTAALYAEIENTTLQAFGNDTDSFKDEFIEALNQWGQELLRNAWLACQEPSEDCPTLDPLDDTSVTGLPKLPDVHSLSRTLNTVVLLHITTSKSYSARTRAFISGFAPIDERAVVSTLKNPEGALRQAQKQAQDIREQHAQKGRALRNVGIGLGAVAGGILVGVTGGLAAPLVGAGVTTILGWLGVGGTAAGLLASGLASSSFVCGALFGAYGARSTVRMVERHTREVRDLAIVPVRTQKEQETLAVRLCVSGWLDSPDDVTAPWTVFSGDDTFALQWEVEALQTLSGALLALVKSQVIKYVKVEILRRTVLASLLSALSPIALLRIGKIIDNPWMNARALALKTGAVLGDLLSSRAFGNRPVTLTGYSLGALVIFEALKYLSDLPPSKTIGLIQDVYLFGSPVPNDTATWASVRRLVCGRLVNGYSQGDYTLAVLSRASDASWGVAGLQPVDVKGVDNVECKGVEGHLQWRGMIGKCLRDCHVPGILDEEVDAQLEEVEKPIEEELQTAETEEVTSASPEV
ncbi:hypothetical protein HYDPIDRAFT_172701 [Hydnomerulius pinastri MD-312]|nr:hypothetical protein HYDPIDRAFT_172701 [Hydnomerulius pinastri MD-312]